MCDTLLPSSESPDVVLAHKETTVHEHEGQTQRTERREVLGCQCTINENLLCLRVLVPGLAK